MPDRRAGGQTDFSTHSVQELSIQRCCALRCHVLSPNMGNFPARLATLEAIYMKNMSGEAETNCVDKKRSLL